MISLWCCVLHLCREELWFLGCFFSYLEEFSTPNVTKRLIHGSRVDDLPGLCSRSEWFLRLQSYCLGSLPVAVIYDIWWGSPHLCSDLAISISCKSAKRNRVKENFSLSESLVSVSVDWYRFELCMTREKKLYTINSLHSCSILNEHFLPRLEMSI